MYPPNPDTAHKQYGAPTPPNSQPPATGIPVGSTTQYPSNYPPPTQYPSNYPPPTQYPSNYPPPKQYPSNYPPPTQYPSNYPPPPTGGRVAWSTGLFDCFSDVKTCCITFWCPCITFGQIAEIADRGSTSCGTSGVLYALIAYFTGCACFYSCFYRSRLREQYMLEESPCWDWLVHFFCETCALCQEYRELQNRGYNMVLGWNGNVQQQNRGVAITPTAPTFEQGMTR